MIYGCSQPRELWFNHVHVNTRLGTCTYIVHVHVHVPSPPAVSPPCSTSSPLVDSSDEVFLRRQRVKKGRKSPRIRCYHTSYYCRLCKQSTTSASIIYLYLYVVIYQLHQSILYKGGIEGPAGPVIAVPLFLAARNAGHFFIA